MSAQEKPTNVLLKARPAKEKSPKQEDHKAETSAKESPEQIARREKVVAELARIRNSRAAFTSENIDPMDLFPVEEG